MNSFNSSFTVFIVDNLSRQNDTTIADDFFLSNTNIWHSDDPLISYYEQCISVNFW